MTQANEAYGQEDYIKAIELYEQTLREQGVSSDLYYNLGNAYYKHNEFASNTKLRTSSITESR